MRRIVLFAGLVFGSAHASELYFAANLDGDQEVPSNASPGTGFAVARVSDAGNRLRVSYTWSSLGSGLISAHIHGPADAGVNAGVIFNLTPPTGGTAGEVLVREFDLGAGQLDQLLAGRWYINLHSQNFGGGEIRGQLLRATSSGARMQASQEVATVSSNGIGQGRVAVNAAEDLLWLELSWNGLVGTTTAAHIHGPGARGVNAGVLFNLSPPTGESSGELLRFIPVDAGDVGELRGGLWYFNVHSSQFTGGELRGQIDRVFEGRFEP